MSEKAAVPSQTKNCGNCAFFGPYSPTEGNCYRYPPVVTVSPAVLTSVNDPVFTTVRPIVQVDCQACGEYKK